MKHADDDYCLSSHEIEMRYRPGILDYHPSQVRIAYKSWHLPSNKDIIALEANSAMKTDIINGFHARWKRRNPTDKAQHKVLLAFLETHYNRKHQFRLVHRMVTQTTDVLIQHP